ncbi:MAG: chromate transporter [Oscillospiraceae bacterium]|nr:chromate transporter [Oscillospiraceae bacterium]
MKPLGEIFISFFKIGALTFGGGYAMLPVLEYEVCKKRGWAEKQDLLDFFAMGQALPGIIAVNTAVFCGNKRAGFLGGLAAALGVICPSIIIITAIAAFMGAVMGSPIIDKLLFGMNIGVAALLVNAVVEMLKKTVMDITTALLAATAFVAVAFFGLNSLIPLAVGLAVGLIIKLRAKKPEGGGK